MGDDVAFQIILLTYVEVSPCDILAAVKFTRGGLAQLYLCVRQNHALKYLGNGNNMSVTSTAYCTDLGSSLLRSALQRSVSFQETRASDYTRVQGFSLAIWLSGHAPQV